MAGFQMSTEAGDTAHAPDWKDLERRIRCPKCSKAMDTHPYCGPGNIIIDTCERCSHNWLDYGELDRVVRAPDPARPQHVEAPRKGRA